MNKDTTAEHKGTLTELQESIESLEDQIEESNSFWQVFLRGIVTGLGLTIGTTILFALSVTVLTTILVQTGWFPSLSEFLGRFTN